MRPEVARPKREVPPKIKLAAVTPPLLAAEGEWGGRCLAEEGVRAAPLAAALPGEGGGLGEEGAILEEDLRLPNCICGHELGPLPRGPSEREERAPRETLEDSLERRLVLLSSPANAFHGAWPSAISA